MKAIIQTQGRQFAVAQGDILKVNRYQESKAGDSIKIEDVLYVSKDGKATVGAPFVKGAVVTAKVLENKRGDKVTIIKHKKRKGYKRKKGHRQELSVIKIESIQTA